MGYRYTRHNKNLLHTKQYKKMTYQFVLHPILYYINKLIYRYFIDIAYKFSYNIG